MKALFIGGTGTISMAIVRQLACNPQWDIWVLNRGNRNECLPEGVHSIIADIHKKCRKTVLNAEENLVLLAQEHKRSKKN